MPSYRYIDDFSPLNTYKLIRNIPATPDNIGISDAWLTVKSSLSLPDSEAEFSLHITTTPSGIGYVTNYEDYTARLLFTVEPLDSESLDYQATYYYDIKIKLDNSEFYTVETGKLFTTPIVTQVF
jgi:hypothetical protein